MTTLDQNKKIVLDLSYSIMNGDWVKVDSLLADNFQYYGDGRAAMNKQEYIYFMKEILCTSMTEMDMQFLRVVAEDNLVAIDYNNAMTHSGNFMGIPATGKRILATGQFIREVKEEKIINEWQTTNMYGLMVQLGVISTPDK